MDLQLISQLIPGFPLDTIFNPKLPVPVQFPLRPGVTRDDIKNDLARQQWEDANPAQIPAAIPAHEKQAISAEQLVKTCTHLAAGQAKKVANIFHKILPLYGMDHPDYLEEFLPNVIVECAEFSKFEENLNYSAKQLLKVFDKYYTPELARAEAYKPVKIANRVYGGRMGNTAPNDGYDNRGSGAMMLTGGSVMLMYGKYKGINPKDVPALLRTSLEYALDSACWFFAVYKSLKTKALQNKFVEICKAINGGTNGLNDRIFYHGRLLKVL